MRSSGDGTAGGAPGRIPGESGRYVLRAGAPGHAPSRPLPVPHGQAVSAAPADPAGPTDPAERIGYRGPTACAASRHHLPPARLLGPDRARRAERAARARFGSQRLYSFRDVVVLKIVKRFLDTGVSLQNIRTAVQHLREQGLRDLERVTLMSDGATVYECTSPDEVHALLQGGQGIFGIAVGVVWRDVEGALSQLHGERVDTGETLVGAHPADELARRRNRAV